MDFDPAAIAELRNLGRRRTYRSGDALFVEGDDGGRVFVIESGRVKVGTVTRDGRSVMLAIRGAGEVVGEMSALDGQPRSATATAAEDVEVTVIATSTYREWLLARPDTMMTHLVRVIRRLRDSDTKRVELSTYDIDRRVAIRLCELAEEHGERSAEGAVRITIPLSQEELGAFAGASREAVARSLQRLRSRRVVETSRRGYLVLDPDALRQLASG